MEKNNNNNSRGLKGMDQINKMKKLMGLSLVNENTSHSVLELTKMGPDGKVYGIVRENHKYFIKTSSKKSNLIAEDFNYVGGLQNISEGSYDSYAKAIKQLNLKFISLRDALGLTEGINVFKNDNLTESFESYSEAPKPSQPDTLMGTVKSVGKNDGHDKEVIGDAGETGNPDVSDAPVVEEDEEVCEDCDLDEEVELSESERLIDKMIKEVRENNPDIQIKGKRLSITTALQKIDEGINSSVKKKV